MSKRNRKVAAIVTVAAAAVFAGPAHAQEEIRLGSIATLEGPFASGGQDGHRGITLALEEVNYEINGKKIVWTAESSNAQADVALARARKLIEQDQVDIIVGPLSGAEGIALRDYSRTLTGKTIVNGSSAASDTTLRDPSPNFFRFSTEGAQWMAGLGNYVFQEMGVEHVAVIANDYAFPYAQVFGFMVDYCRAGGKVTKLWSPLGTTDYSSVITRIPRDAGALLVIKGGTDALAFLTQYAQTGGELPIIGGSIMADQTLMSARGPHQRLMEGMISAGPIADIHDDPMWQEWVERYRERFPDGLQSPSIHGFNYYTNTKAILLALQEVGGDLSDNQQKFQQALANLEFKNPMGATVKLDENRQAISDIFFTRIVKTDDGLRTESFGRADGVDQRLGLSPEEFEKLGSPSRDNPSCPPVS
ncbi:ABC transporter substrate-binding protein [Telmatospirillum sp. J64-1]|uniref:ABC transporter substrate-binding protein n=1 Tax=Telmatospirillum sp. J64-1 TaxID=2502183 RepID=UPI00115C7A44|nr:ABC transporter substrate-binding protein [Telmatospirillum sp. J64-1]